MSTIIREMYGDLDPWGRFWLILGAVTLAAAAAMSISFGWCVSVKHALFLGCLSVITAFVPDVAHQQWRDGHKMTSLVIAAVCLPLFLLEFYSHAGYTAGLRGENIGTAKVQNTKYDDRRDSIAKAEETRSILMAEKARILEQKAWLATVTAEGLRADLEPKRLAVDLEAKRGGCKAKCLKLKEDVASLEAKIAEAEKVSDLDKRLAAADRAIEQAKDKSEATEFKFSAVSEQNAFLAKAVALVAEGSLEPTEFQEQGAQQTVNLAMAFAGTGLPALCFFIVGLYRNPSHRRQMPMVHSAEHSPATPWPMQSGKIIERTTKFVRDEAFARNFRAARHLAAV